MALILINPPAVEPVSLAELREFLALDIGDTSKDNILMTLAMAARSWCEVFTQRRFVQQTWQLLMDFFPGYIDIKLAGSKVSSPFVSGSNAVLVGIRYAIALPFPPISSVSAFTYLNANGQVTGMSTGPFNIAAISNVNGQPINLETSAPHGLQSGASVTIAGNAALLALLGQSSEVISVIDSYNLTLLGTTGTGATISASGTVTGYNYVQDLLSNPARLMPVFGQMWPVARVVANAVAVTFTCGYAIPITVAMTSGTDASQVTATGYTFQSSDIGRQISIPGAGLNGATLNTVITSVSGANAETRDPSSAGVTSAIALLVNGPSANPAHWEMFKAAIKLLVNHWYENRLPDEGNIPMAVKSILWPTRDLRF